MFTVNIRGILLSFLYCQHHARLLQVYNLPVWKNQLIVDTNLFGLVFR